MASHRMYSVSVATTLVVVCLASMAAAVPQPRPDDVFAEMRSNCENGVDSLACMKYKVVTFLNSVFTEDNYKMFGNTEVRSNGYVAASDEQLGRSAEGAAAGTIVDVVGEYVQSHDVTVDVPLAGAKVTVSPRNIDNDELSVSIKFAPEGRSAVEARKSKLKKIVIPIMVFVLLKAMTLIPLALGVLGLKAFNALQLSFFSFVASIALAIFQLCKKIATDNHHPQLAAHAPWEVRSFAGDAVQPTAQQMAYAAHTN